MPASEFLLFSSEGRLMAARIHLISFTFCPLAVIVCVSGGTGTADPKGAPSDLPASYADKANHLWNRLHAAILVRTGPDGKNYGRDLLEPLMWSDSVHLLRGKSAERAVAVLEEFVSEGLQAMSRRAHSSW